MAKDKELQVMETQKLVERIAKLRFFHKNTYEEIGKIIGYSPISVKRFIEKAISMGMLPEYAKGNEVTFNNSKEYREQKMMQAHDKIITRMSNDEVVKAASLSELANSGKKLFEMMRLENDKSTSNNAMSGLLKLVEAANPEDEL